MFNHSLKKDALRIHNNAVERYNVSYEEMRTGCDDLFNTRDRSLGKIVQVEALISTIANRPKEFDKQLGEIKQEVLKFHQTKEYADEAFREAVKSGVGILSGVAAGGTIAAAAPSVAMSIATTFGTTSTGTAISSLSGAAARKAAIAWIGRKTGGIATKGVIIRGGLVSGRAFLALAGPIGWGITAVSAAAALESVSRKNKKISDEAIEEAKEIMNAREILMETTAKISGLKTRTNSLMVDLFIQLERAKNYKNKNYSSLDENAQLFLGTLVNNTLSLAALLNETVA